ncbi:MAG: hypothetical protein DMG37_23655 [Acidobacteria bacterium]|nr:MAG: hypothetical protein DMG37_23655 [Acidobacteriota bacterium]
MLDLAKYQSVGAALKDALDRFAREVCLIEADREREKERLTYRDFKERAHPLAKALQDAGFSAGNRASIIMTNQSKWLISAYAVFFAGGALVPLDYKLTPDEQWQLLKHSGATILITEYPVWRQLSVSAGRASASVQTVLVTEAPSNAELAGAKRWEEFRGQGEPAFVPRNRSDTACIVYSSGTGGRPKGCMMTHENYLEQCVALTSLYPFWPGVSVSEIQDHLREPRSAGLEEFAKRSASALRCFTTRQAQSVQRARSHQQNVDEEPAVAHQPPAAQTGPRSVWRRAARHHCRRRFHRAPDFAVFL